MERINLEMAESADERLSFTKEFSVLANSADV